MKKTQELKYIPLSPEVIAEAHTRIAPFIHRTPLLESTLLNKWLGHRIVFKAEGLQKIGAFKARGAFNSVLSLKESGKLPKALVAFSSGNHAQAVAVAGSMLDIPTTIVLPGFTSAIKQQATRSYGAEVILTPTRLEAEARCAEIQAEGAYFIHPFDDDQVIAGQGTACFEALQDWKGSTKPHAVFAPCGGGGLPSGTYLATQLLSPKTQVYAAEPLQANDAAQSYRLKKIIGFPTSPETLADGARTLVISERTFSYLQQLAGFYEVSEQDIVYWTQWLTHLLKISVEPTSALAMGAAFQWLSTQTEPKEVLVILSGGNISPEAQRIIWTTDCLGNVPTLAR
ncbi:MAG: Pyridoxal-5-phosphate-dependent protein beta subunit [Rickettsiales bacterium]|jgi:threonine dehydratase|nr:Pyridoxal-5-phosphate-dependent protein beta subunit [Rickettsiales bacterium]